MRWCCVPWARLLTLFCCMYLHANVDRAIACKAFLAVKLAAQLSLTPYDYYTKSIILKYQAIRNKILMHALRRS
jgi:hypothetical protein